MQGTIQITGMTLDAFWMEMDRRYSNINPTQEEATKPEEMNTRQVRKHLLQKGYRINSDPSFTKFVKDRGLTRTRRGKEFWYKTVEIEAIPSRRIK